MLVKTLIASALAATAFGVSIPKSGHMSCGTAPPTAAQLAAHKAMAITEEKTGAAKRSPASVQYIDTYVHVVSNSSDSSTAPNWYLSRAQIDSQMAVLNQYFNGTGYQYTLKDVDWTVNAIWAVTATDDSTTAMKTALRKGNYQTLNLYYVTDISGSHTNTGFCNFPFANASSRAGWLASDGCVMSAWTAPGGDSPWFSTGRITVHEVGHWHNLLHTFEGDSCTGTGDLVSDTPAQRSASSGCPTGRDSCPRLAGLDPINNHMDYTDDTCKTEFTPGQIARMQSSWTTYRA
ncbi:hypothetical protein NLG97_g7392 [Lecanicillium saksenae]|uniref:Uncharacterized protein n=1 Tax=Lecanicillium saksenae TaxID=468837 RepID=A0ACC1QNS6_9HYPO|nr:hypothetical protein NLG97_g7392 [Lecanicillium saksenae]